MRKETKKNKFKEWILGHRKIVTITIITFSITFIFLFAMFYKKHIKSNNEYILILSYSAQIVSALFVISGVVIAIWQYYLSYIDSQRNKDLICVQKAVDLSEYYKDNILCYISPINYIFTKSGISDILKKIDKDRIKHFDIKELETFLSEDDTKHLKEIQTSDNFFDIIINANLIYNLGLSEQAIELYKKTDKDFVKEAANPHLEILSRFLNKLIIKVLNNMEYFALHFTHNVADETVVYKSLHQTYIEAVQMFYYNIATCNPISPSKYYTNIIELYEAWNVKFTEAEENFVSGVRNFGSKGTVIESIESK